MTLTERPPITAADAKSFVPPLSQFAGNYKLKRLLLGFLERPMEQDSNVLIVGQPGEGKTATAASYLRERFHNPWFYQERRDPQGKASKTRNGVSGSTDEIREWQSTPHGLIYFKQINGATDSAALVRSKLEELMYVMDADHRVLFVDELGELYFNGLDETLRPVLTEPGISVIGTAQNFHSKRKTDTAKEEDERLVALLRRFTHNVPTELPTDREHLTFLAYLIKEWRLKVDRPETLTLLVHKAQGIVGWSQRILVRAIDEPGRKLTYDMVDSADVDPR
jgi:hypothetical protein